MTFRVPNAGQGKRFAVNGSTILLILDAIDPLFGDEWQMYIGIFLMIFYGIVKEF